MSYAFLTRPRWIVGHLLALVLLAAFISAGSWQLSRHFDRQERNADVLGRANEPALDTTDLWPTDATDLAELEWRLVNITGSWARTEAVVIRNRSQEGLAGCHLAAPLELDTANRVQSSTPIPLAVLVVAGWLPSTDCARVTSASTSPPGGSRTNDTVPDGTGDGTNLSPSLTALNPLAAEALPAGSINLQGRVRRTQTRGLFGAADSPSGRLTSLARVDVRRIDAQTSQSLAPPYVELVSTTPPLTSLEALGPPVTDAGPHLGYTFQYFAFATVTLVGYPLVLTRQARKGRHASDF